MSLVLSYLKTCDKKIGNYQIFFRLMEIVFCSKIFTSKLNFYYFSYPLFIQPSTLFGILAYKDVDSLNFNNDPTLANSGSPGQEAVKRSGLLTVYYRVIETKQDGEALVNDPRNQLEGELFVAVVINENYLDEIKRLTLSGKGKRTPIFISSLILEKLKLLSESPATAQLPVYDFAREKDRHLLISYGLRAVKNSTVSKNHFSSSWHISYSLSEYKFLQSFKRYGKTEELHQHFIANIDNPLQFFFDGFSDFIKNRIS